MLTCQLLVGVKANKGLVVTVHEPNGLHVGAVVVPHPCQLQLHRYLRTPIDPIKSCCLMRHFLVNMPVSLLTQELRQRCCRFSCVLLACRV